MTQTFILGKDSSLEESISKFKSNLNKAGFTLEESKLLNPITNVYSIHIKDSQAPSNFTNGKGKTELACIASAYGEYIERLSTNYFFADYYLGKEIANSEFVHYPSEKWFKTEHDENYIGIFPKGLLNSNLFDYYVKPHLDDGKVALDAFFDIQSKNIDRGIVALPFVQESNKETVYIPASLITNIFASNGMSAGNTFSEAKVQALSEIFERGIKEKILKEKISLPRIPQEVIAKYHDLDVALQSLNQGPLIAFGLDCSMGGKFPVLAIILINQNNNTIYASFGSHPKFEVALERSITELLQGRSLNQLDVFNEPSIDTDQVADHTNIETHFIDSSGLLSWKMISKESDFEFCHWDFIGSTAEELDYLINLVHHELKLDLYVMEYDHLEICAVRVLVPGFSDIYTLDSFYYEGNSKLNCFYDTIQNLVHNKESDLSDNAEKVIEYIENNFDDSERLRELLGFIPGKNSWWHSLRVAEFLALFHIEFMCDYSKAYKLIEWGCELNSSLHTSEQRNFWNCLKHALGLQEEFVNQYEDLDLEGVFDKLQADHLDNFALLFGTETAEKVFAIIAGEESALSILKAPEGEFEKFPDHRKLINSYKKLQLAKVKK